KDVDIALPAALTARAAERNWEAKERPAQPWSLAGALAALRDSAADPSPSADGASGTDKGMRSRALVVFSTGAEGTSITPEDLANQANASGVPIYPIALWESFGQLRQLPYDGYTFEAFKSTDAQGRRSMWGPAGPYRALFVWSRDEPPTASYINFP